MPKLNSLIFVSQLSTMLKAAHLFLLCLLALGAKGKDGERQKKIFSLFTIVTFPNDMCSGKSTTDTGTCLTGSECTSRGGKADGNCAAGFGVCCTFTSSTCGSTVAQNRSYITNPGYPSAYTNTGACTFSVTPLSSNICQLRLDFDNFDIVDDTTTGACTDSFTVSMGSSRVYPVLCGTLTGQHIYLETGRSTASQTLTFNTATATTSKTWKARVSQIECYAPYRAPSDCFQYYTGITGNIQSLNFVSQIPLQNMLYTACVRQEYGFCGIYWTSSPETSTIDTFHTGPAATKSGTDASDTAQGHVVIPGSTNVEYSGTIFSNILSPDQTVPGAVLATGQRFHLGVFTDAATQTATDGFDLSWNQAPCSTAGQT